MIRRHDAESNPAASSPEEMLRCQAVTARIVGALAHELNNPLQGVMSLLSLFSRECADSDSCRRRLEQIRGGVARLAQIVDSVAVVYENLPRAAERITIGSLTDALADAFAERQIALNVQSPEPRERVVFCHVPEVVRLLAECCRNGGRADRAYRAHVDDDEARIVLVCERWPDGRDAGPWRALDETVPVSGLFVLIDEMMRLGGGEAEFRFDSDGMCGIRLRLRTQMARE